MNERLHQLMPPPVAKGRSTSTAEWLFVEHELGLTLPSDYKDFDADYGEGFIANELGINIGADLLDAIDNTRETIGVLRDEFPDLYKVGIFPEPGGFLAWARSGNGHCWYWDTTRADPSSWTIVVEESGTFPPAFHRYDVCMTDYLIGFVERRWPDPICRQWPFGYDYVVR